MNTLHEPDFPHDIVHNYVRKTDGISGGTNTSKYCEIVPILPFIEYTLMTEHFSTMTEIQIIPVDKFRTLSHAIWKAMKDSTTMLEKIFKRGFLELGYTYFGDMATMLKVAPDLFKRISFATCFVFF